MAKAKKPVSAVPITDRQQKIYDFIVKYYAKHSYPPTIREIGEGMKIVSPNGVLVQLSALEKKGYIQREENVARGIRLLKADKCPCCGRPY